MGIKQDIVIVNEYSTPLPGGKGSRGGTPGSYVERYMARDGATEVLAPIQRQRTDDFILRYMARESAVEHAPSRTAAKKEMRDAQGRGGVAFGYGEASLSDDQLRAASRDIQRRFESGKTVLKTVLSFDESYLKKHGIVPEDFTLRQRGDYRGHLDQMKLRLAIMHGLDRMASGSGGYDDLRYVGVIQVDTEHVHAHLAMVDAGTGQITKDGTQRGKLLEKHKSRLRRGIDSWLDEKQTVKHLASAVGYERRNVTAFVKKWAHERIASESLPQFLLACLPEDRQLWRAGSHDPRMRKANQLVTELVTEQLERPGSPMPAAMEKVISYADDRRTREGLGFEDWQKLVDTGRDQILERAVNGVYGVLRALPEEELRVRTPMLQVMSMDYEQMATRAASEQEKGQSEEDDLVSFGFRLRSYSSRLNHHAKKAAEYRELGKRWEDARDVGVAAADSKPLYDFYREEEDWHDGLRDKYQHFLPFLGDQSQWWREQQQVAEYGRRLLALRALRQDASLQRMKDAEDAERLGREIYDQPGGRHLTDGTRGRAILDARLRTMEDAYAEKVADLAEKLGDKGLQLEISETPPAPDPAAPRDAHEVLEDLARSAAPDSEVDEPGGPELILPDGQPASAPPPTLEVPPGHVQRRSGLIVRRRTSPVADEERPEQPANTAVVLTVRSSAPTVPVLLPIAETPASLQVSPGLRHEFRDVKALDLHHLGFDFARDVEIGRSSARTFVRAAELRQRALVGAMDYLDGSGQSAAITQLPVADIAAMNQLARTLQEQMEKNPATKPILPSRIQELREQQMQEAADRASLRRSKATTLDAGVLVQVRERVDREVGAVSAEQERESTHPGDREH